ncbi:hypothetical protein ABIB27_001432 [Arthrobacter sp. UYEF21]
MLDHQAGIILRAFKCQGDEITADWCHDTLTAHQAQ